MVKTDVYGLCFSEKWSVICYIARRIKKSHDERANLELSLTIIRCRWQGACLAQRLALYEMTWQCLSIHAFYPILQSRSRNTVKQIYISYTHIRNVVSTYQIFHHVNGVTSRAHPSSRISASGSGANTPFRPTFPHATTPLRPCFLLREIRGKRIQLAQPHLRLLSYSIQGRKSLFCEARGHARVVAPTRDKCGDEIGHE